MLKTWLLLLILAFPLNVFADSTEQKVNAQPDTHFTVTLPANHSTGFSWSLAAYDQTMIRYIESKYVNEDAKLGSPGKEFWTFEPLKNGKTEIKLEYRRPWESVSPAQTAVIHVHIGAAGL